MDTITKIILIMNILVFLMILRKLYIVRHHGKLDYNCKKVDSLSFGL